MVNYTSDDCYAGMYKAVCQYANISLTEAKQLPTDEFLLYFRNSVIDSLLQSKEGRDVLKNWQRDTVDDDEDGVDKLLKVMGGGIIG